MRPSFDVRTMLKRGFPVSIPLLPVFRYWNMDTRETDHVAAGLNPVTSPVPLRQTSRYSNRLHRHTRDDAATETIVEGVGELKGITAGFEKFCEFGANVAGLVFL